VLLAAVRSDVLDGDHPEISRLRPLSRLGRDEWATVPEVLEIRRIRWADWPARD